MSNEIIVSLKHPSGSQARITRFGAHVISFKTAKGTECLYLSPKSSLTGPAPIRGGIPICWPAFGFPDKGGPFGKLSLHGFARQQVWLVASQEADKAVFKTASSPSTRGDFDHEFALSYTVALDADSLKIQLDVSNPKGSAKDLPCQVAFHNYLQLPQDSLPAHVRVKDSLNGLQYKNLVKGGAVETDNDKIFKFSGETGKIYQNAPQTLVVDGDNGVTIRIETDGLPELVVHHPGAEKGASIPDLPENGWKEYVCFEPANISTPIQLKPGESWSCSQILKAVEGDRMSHQG